MNGVQARQRCNCMYTYIGLLVYVIYIVYMYIHTYESSTVCKHANAATVCMYIYISIYDIYCIYVHTHIRIIYGMQARQRCNCMYVYILVCIVHMYITHTNHLRCASSLMLQLHLYTNMLVYAIFIVYVCIRTYESSTARKPVNGEQAIQGGEDA